MSAHSWDVVEIWSRGASGGGDRRVRREFADEATAAVAFEDARRRLLEERDGERLVQVEMWGPFRARGTQRGGRRAQRPRA